MWWKALAGPTGSESCMVGDVHDIITCATFQIEILMGYDFTGGRIFEFPTDFCMGLYNSAVLMHCMSVVLKRTGTQPSQAPSGRRSQVVSGATTWRTCLMTGTLEVQAPSNYPVIKSY